MPVGARPRLELAVLGLDPLDGAGSGDQHAAPVWTWPEGLASRGALTACLAGRFVPGRSGSHAIDDCHRDDPDRQALAMLGRDEAAEGVDA
ncbi:MAG: hypothetical protein ACOCSG_07230, partial [Guyparkeria sp.]